MHFAILAPFSPDNCTDGSVRLTHGSTPRNGTVQVCVNRTWGSICDSGWSSRDATVVCRQLGFPTLGNRYLTSLCTLARCAFNHYGCLYNPLGAIPHFNSFYGIASGPVWFGYMYCTGIESRILNCVHSRIGSSCSSRDHSGVECPGMPLGCYFWKHVSIQAYLHALLKHDNFVAVLVTSILLCS